MAVANTIIIGSSIINCCTIVTVAIVVAVAVAATIHIVLIIIDVICVRVAATVAGINT